MRVVVTRPEREAHVWAAALAQHRLDALVLPLVVILPVDGEGIRTAWEATPDYRALMFVSGAAVEHFFAYAPPASDGPGACSDQPRFWVPGPGSAAALLRHGVDPSRIDSPPDDSGQFDSEALWKRVSAQVRAGDRVLLVRGRDAAGEENAAAGSAGSGRLAARTGMGRDWLAQQLAQAGVHLGYVVAYERHLPSLDPQQTAQAQVAAADGSIWLFTTAQAVANLRHCLPEQEWSSARALATHPRIAAAARAAGFGVVWESRPSVGDVVASIELNA